MSSEHGPEIEGRDALEGLPIGDGYYGSFTPVSVRGRAGKSTLPYMRDVKFVDRDDVFYTLDSFFSTQEQHQRVALWGLGGTGKSQIAIEYTYRLQERNSNLTTLWVYAANVDQLYRSFRDVAFRLGIPGAGHENADTIGLVLSWLGEEKNGPWLLILDGVDDASPIITLDADSKHKELEQPHRLLQGRIPHTINGKVLATSRNRNAGYSVVGEWDNLIKVGLMDEPQALRLLQARCVISGPDMSDARALVAAVGYLPLAISQAASYVTMLGKLTNLSDYLYKINGSSFEAKALLARDFTDLRRDASLPNAVISTWEYSFRQVMELSPDAAKMLSCLAMYHWYGVPFDLVHTATTRAAAREALALLLDYAFVSVDNDDDQRMTLTMHRFVTLAIQQWMDVAGTLQVYRERAVNHLHEVLLEVIGQAVILPAAYIPHITTVVAYESYDRDTELNRSELLCYSALYHHNIKREAISDSNIEACFEILRNCIGSWKKKVKDDGSVEYREWGNASTAQLQTAEKIASRCVDRLTKRLGTQDPRTLEMRLILGSAYRQQRRLEEAERTAIRVQETIESMKRSSLFARRELNLLDSNCLRLLAQVRDYQGRSEEAIWLRSSAVGLLQLRDSEAPDLKVFEFTFDLAFSYLSASRNQEAYDTLLPLHTLCEAKLGPHEFLTAQTLRLLAHSSFHLGRYDDSENYARAALREYQILFVDENRYIAEASLRLASALLHQTRYIEAEQTARDRLKVLRAHHPDEHARMASLLEVLSIATCAQGRFSESEKLSREERELLHRSLPDEHRLMAMCMGSLVEAVHKQGRFAEAERLARERLEFVQRRLPQDTQVLLIAIRQLERVLSISGPVKNVIEYTRLSRRASAIERTTKVAASKESPAQAAKEPSKSTKKES